MSQSQTRSGAAQLLESIPDGGGDVSARESVLQLIEEVVVPTELCEMAEGKVDGPSDGPGAAQGEEPSRPAALLAFPIAAWEFSVGMWMLAKGFNSSPILDAREEVPAVYVSVAA